MSIKDCLLEVKNAAKDFLSDEEANELLLNIKNKLELKKLQKRIEELIEQKNTTTIINIDKQINLNSYGSEDLSHITTIFKDNLLKAPYSAIPKMIEEVHFNENKPENKNILLPNKKENFVKIFQNDKWIYKDKKEAINNLMEHKYTIIDNHYVENSNEEKDDKYESFRYDYNSNKNTKAEIIADCELVLLNNR